MAKATHTGTCQICGATQKLPSGRLSKHGYTVDYGFFNGVCSGAHGLPFEQSTDLIENVVANVTAQRVAVLADAEALATETGIVWMHLYTSNRRGSGRYEWRKVDASELNVEAAYENSDGETVYHVKYRAEDMRRSHELGGYTDGPTANDKILAENAKRAKYLLDQAEKMQTYIDWQQERVSNWTPGELVEV